jgi:hypothetical protein
VSGAASPIPRAPDLVTDASALPTALLRIRRRLEYERGVLDRPPGS